MRPVEDKNYNRSGGVDSAGDPRNGKGKGDIQGRRADTVYRCQDFRKTMTKGHLQLRRRLEEKSQKGKQKANRGES